MVALSSVAEKSAVVKSSWKSSGFVMDKRSSTRERSVSGRVAGSMFFCPVIVLYCMCCTVKPKHITSSLKTGNCSMFSRLCGKERKLKKTKSTKWQTWIGSIGIPQQTFGLVERI